MSRIYFLKSEIKPKIGGQYIEGLIGEPKLINPILAANDVDLSLSHLIFSGLLKYNKDLELKPDLVESLSSSEDQKEYTFCLRQNIFWHDGEKLTVDDVIFTYELIKNPDFKNPFSERLKELNLSKLNENCLKFNLEKKSNSFLSLLTLGILPKHIWEKIELDQFSQTEFNLKPVGSGPFKFTSLARDSTNQIKFYTLGQNKEFYNYPPYLEEITFKFYSDFVNAVEDLKNMQINGLGYSPKGITQNLSEMQNLNHYQLNLPYYTAIFLNLQIKEDETSFLSQKAVRNALAYLTPKQQIFQDILYQQGKIIHGPILPHSPVFNPDLKQYDYQPQLAETFLINDGWKKNTQAIWEKNEKMLEISLTTIDQPDFQAAAELIQQAWQEMGIFVKLIIIPAGQIREIIVNRNFQAFLYGILENANADPYPIWHSSQKESPGLNLTGFQNRRADELLEKAALTDDPEAKKRYYYEFQEIISENLPAIFLYNPTYSYLVDQKIKGIDIRRINYPEDRFIEVENWYIETKRTIK